jgi:hypothetical protein
LLLWLQEKERADKAKAAADKAAKAEKEKAADGKEGAAADKDQDKQPDGKAKPTSNGNA